jgi:hypothetical protein
MKILVGSTGLVGQTIKESVNFDFEFNSKNIHQFDEVVPNGCELWLSCLPATKWMVNKDLKKDIENIYSILSIIKEKKYSKVVLISTIDVYNDSPLFVDELYKPNFGKLSYGNNRLLFEFLVGEFLIKDNYKIYRLPALFNSKIKKNILFDLINNNNIESIDGNTHFQWFNLDNLYKFIINTIESERTLFNVFTEPIKTQEIIDLFPKHKNKTLLTSSGSIIYNYKTNTTVSGYIQSSNDVLIEIKKFVNETIVK